MQSDIRAKLIQVIEVDHLRSGEESLGLPSRWVKTYWDLKGNFLSENDPVMTEISRKGSLTPDSVTSTEIFRPRP